GARTNLDAALRESGRTEAPGRRSLLWHRALVIGQLALCFVLLVCAGLMARTFYLLQQNPIGFQPRGVMTMTFDLPGAVTKYGRDVNERTAFHERLLSHLRAQPGVVSVGTASRLPFAEALDPTDAPGRVRFAITDRPVPPDERPFARVEVISSGYLQTLGIPLLEGRDFDARDTLQSAPVVLVNHELVRRYIPGDGVVGRTLLDLRKLPPTIVGVVGNVKPTPVALSPEPTIYVAMSQSPIFRTRLAIRAQGDQAGVVSMVRRTVASVDPELPVFDIKPLEGIAADAVATQRFALMLFALFAALALGLSVIGIYSVLAYAVAHRVPEFGVRLALGARPGQLLQMVLAQGARMALLGLALGAGVSMLATRGIRGLLFGVQPFDPITLGGVAILFCAIAMAACLLPARRAAGIEPLAALRNE
ncbi:MAG: FtsX-like permease family protein, partial [Longimicrobiales bacterium]